MAQDIKTLKETRSLLNEIKSTLTDVNEGYKNINRSQNKGLQDYKKILESLLKSGELDRRNIAKRGDLIKQLVDGNVDLTNIASKRAEIQKKMDRAATRGWKKAEKGYKVDLDILDSYEKRLKTQELTNTAMDGLDSITGGMGSKVKDAKDMMGKMGMKAGLAAGAMMAIVAILVSFSGKMDAIGAQFGAIGIHSSEIRGDLLQAEVSATKLGKSLEDVMTAVTTMSSEFGMSFSESRGLAASVIDTSTALGLSTSEGAQLIGVFTQISGLSGDAATALSKQVTLLATASDVAPQQVLKDIAGSSEAVAGFTDATGKNIKRAAIQARKLGTNLDTSASAAEKLLDVQSSLQASLTASVLIGRNINIQKLQELSLAGDVGGVTKEQRRLLGSQSEWLSLMQPQRKALAESLGLSVDQAAKMLSHEKEAITLAGQLAGQTGFDELVGEKGISTLTQLTGSLKSLGATLTNSFGPIVNIVLKLLVGVGKVLEWILEPINMFLKPFNMGIDNSFSAVPSFAGLPAGKMANISSGAAVAHSGETIVNMGDFTELTKELKSLRGDMDSYMGVGGTLAGNIGKSTVRGIERTKLTG